MSKSVLVIDDEALVTKTLKILLIKQGYNVSIAENGFEALKQIKEFDFNLIISDIRMPDMDGIETIKEIRTYLKESNKRLIPEILITGYADTDKYDEAISLGVTDYLFKPFDNVDFLGVVKKYLNN